MQNGVSIMQNILRADRPPQVAWFIGQQSQTEDFGNPFDKAGGQVREWASFSVRVQVERKVYAAAAIEKVVIAKLIHAEYQVPRPAIHEAGPPDAQGIVWLLKMSHHFRTRPVNHRIEVEQKSLIKRAIEIRRDRSVPGGSLSQ